ncbi:unnamed protein product [Protopolystoma xenopodis]|uniref:Uncharacterized protein n=1 Tax=Protopolystoma xenopodis TaxID=117903 RepID=A0A3S5AZC5_9PLAT|nr:unnamed protein product [Protopolystoma xenopodis]
MAQLKLLTFRRAMAVAGCPRNGHEMNGLCNFLNLHDVILIRLLSPVGFICWAGGGEGRCEEKIHLAAVSTGQQSKWPAGPGAAVSSSAKSAYSPAGETRSNWQVLRILPDAINCAAMTIGNSPTAFTAARRVMDTLINSPYVHFTSSMGMGLKAIVAIGLPKSLPKKTMHSEHYG